MFNFDFGQLALKYILKCFLGINLSILEFFHFYLGKGSQKKICKFWDIGQISLTPPPL